MDQEPSNSKQVTSILPLNHNSNYKFIIEMMMKMTTMTTTITFSIKTYKGGKFPKNLWCCISGRVQGNLVLSVEFQS